MKKQKEILSNSKAMELNAVLNEVGGAVDELEWTYGVRVSTIAGTDKMFEVWIAKWFIIKKQDGRFFLYEGKNKIGSSLFNKLESAKMVAQLIYNG